MDKITDSDPTKVDNNVCVPPVHKPSLDICNSKASSSRGDESIPMGSNKHGVHASTVEDEHDNPHHLNVGSPVQHFDKYGVITWIGVLPGDKKVYAKVEMVSINNINSIKLIQMLYVVGLENMYSRIHISLQEDYVGSSRDGIWKGVKYKLNKEKFTFLGSLKPDQRIKKDASPGM